MRTDHERPQILKDLEAGTITAEEANRRLAALDTAAPLPDHDLPHVRDLRENWRLPFAVSMGGALLAGLKLASRPRQGFLNRVQQGFYWMALVAFGLVGLLAWWSRQARWLLVKIQTRDGQRFQISLPVPVHLLARLFRAVRPWVDEETAQQLDAAVEFIDTMQDEMDSPDGQPVIIDINDEENRVQVYLI